MRRLQLALTPPGELFDERHLISCRSHSRRAADGHVGVVSTAQERLPALGFLMGLLEVMTVSVVYRFSAERRRSDRELMRLHLQASGRCGRPSAC